MDSVLKRSRSYIISAILKNGISATVVGPPWNGGGPQPNFTLSATVVGPPWNGGGPQPILEYCDPEKAISREDY